MLKRGGQSLTQRRFVLGRHLKTGHWQLNRVFFETVQAWKAIRRQEVAIHTQVRVPTWPRPIGQLGVHTFAVHHQGAHQTNVLPLELAHQLRRNALGCLRLHRCAVVNAMLRAKLDIQQAQEMPHLSGRTHGGLATTTTQTLLNRHRRRNAVHRVHLRPTRWLHDAACVGVEAF